MQSLEQSILKSTGHMSDNKEYIPVHDNNLIVDSFNNEWQD